MKKTTFTAMGSLATAVCLTLGAGTASADAKPDAHYDNGYMATIGAVDTVDVLRNDVPSPGSTWDVSTLKIISPDTGLPVNSYTNTGFRNDGTEGEIFKASVVDGKINFLFNDTVSADLQYQITDTSGKTFETTVEAQGAKDGVYVNPSTKADNNITFEKRDKATGAPLSGATLSGESCRRNAAGLTFSCEKLDDYGWFRDIVPANAGAGMDVTSNSDINGQKYYTSGSQFINNIVVNDYATGTNCDDTLLKVTAREASAPAGYDKANGEISLCLTNQGWILDSNTGGDNIKLSNTDYGTTVTFLNSKLAPEVPAVAVNDTTSGEYGAEQVANVLKNDTPSGAGSFTKVELLDANGNAVNTLNTNGGTYTVKTDKAIGYMPKAGFFGTDAPVTYRATDSNGKSVTATLTATVNPAAKGATKDDSTTVDPGQTAKVDVLANDTKGSTEFDPSTLTVKGNDASQGTWSIVDGQVQFVHADGFTGDAKATYTVKDEGGNEYMETVTVTVKPVLGPPPMAEKGSTVADSTTVEYGATAKVDVLANDKRGTMEYQMDSLTVKGNDATQGAWSIVDGQVQFVPADGFSGDAKATYSFVDGAGYEYTETVTVTVKPKAVVTPPADVKGSTKADSTTVKSGETAKVDVLANDTKGSTEFDPSTLTVKGNDASQGTWSVVDGQVQLVPAADFTGDAKATYTVKDKAGNEYTETVTVTVEKKVDTTTPVEPTATGVDDHATTKQDTPVVIDVLANDKSNPGTIEKGSTSLVDDNNAPSDAVKVKGGTFTLKEGKLVFTPEKGFYGESGTVSYHGISTDGVSYTAKVSVTVTKADTPAKPNPTPTKPQPKPTKPGTSTTTPKPGTTTVPSTDHGKPSTGTGSNTPAPGNMGNGGNTAVTPGPVIQTDMGGGSDASTGLLGFSAMAVLGGAAAALRRRK